MRTIHKLVGTLVVVSMSSLATAATAQTAAESKAADFRALEAEMQQESTNLPSSSPRRHHGTCGGSGSAGDNGAARDRTVQSARTRDAGRVDEHAVEQSAG